jgi:hypothetical protein
MHRPAVAAHRSRRGKAQSIIRLSFPLLTEASFARYKGAGVIALGGVALPRDNGGGTARHAE